MTVISVSTEWKRFVTAIQWRAALFWIVMHIAFVYSIYIGFTAAKWQTIIFTAILGQLTGIGMSVAAHRYYTHQTFKANLPLKLVLISLQTLCGQLSILDWAINHHLHHKYVETDADTTNIKRGWFFAQIGWLCTEFHPKCAEKRADINANYLTSCPLVRFQHKYYWYLALLINVMLPTLAPYYLFDETIKNSFFLCFVFRYLYTFQVGGLVSSWAHDDDYGYKPYDKSISGVHSQPLIYIAQGGAYHNYHHVFPWDYSESEFGSAECFGVSTAFIDFFALIGWAYDLRKAPPKLIDARKRKSGDGSRTKLSSVVLDWVLGITISSYLFLVFLPFRLISYY